VVPRLRRVYLLSPLDLRDVAGRTIYLVEELARLLLPPLTLHLFLVFPPGLAVPRGARRVAPFLYLPAAILVVLQPISPQPAVAWCSGKPTAASLGMLDRLELVQLGLYALAAVAVLALRLRRHPAWEERRQLQWIALGLAAGYLPFVLLYAAPRAAGWSVPSALASGASCRSPSCRSPSPTPSCATSCGTSARSSATPRPTP
jgi:hypothetical protein